MAASVDEHLEPGVTARPDTAPDGGPMVSLVAALQFLTLAPPLVRRPFTPRELGWAVAYFPLVGALLGGALAGVNWLFDWWWPPALTAALVLAAWVLCTGALHLDGFLDTCDGLFGGRTPEARLRIMRDEHVGAFAVIGGILLLLVKYVSLASVTDRASTLILAPTLGRWGIVLAISFFPYGRPDGLGRAMKDHAGWRPLVLATATAGATAWLAGSWRGVIALGVAAVAILVGGWFVLRRLPGLTGDIYGALCELVEVLVLLVLVAGENHVA